MNTHFTATKLDELFFFFNFFPHPKQFSDIRMKSQSFLIFDFSKFSVKMSSTNSSQLYFPLNWSGSGIRVVLEGGTFFKMFKTTIHWTS